MWLKRVLPVFILVTGITLAGGPALSGMSNQALAAESLAINTLDSPHAGVFLVAPRAMSDPRFRHSIVYLVAHGQGGSLGLIVNRPGDITLSEAVPDFPAQAAARHSLHFGGPVGLPMILMLARGVAVPEGMEPVNEGVYISSEQPVLEAALTAGAELTLRFYIGYAGWAAGQLQFELAQDGWHIIAGDAEVIFSGDPEALWDRIIDKLEPAGIQTRQAPVIPAFAAAVSLPGQVRSAGDSIESP